MVTAIAASADFPRPIAIGITAEDRIKSWLKPHLHRRLRDPHGRQISHALVALQLQVPPPDGLPHSLEGVATDRRGEVHINPVILVHRLARPERITKKRVRLTSPGRPSR